METTWFILNLGSTTFFLGLYPLGLILLPLLFLLARKSWRCRKLHRNLKSMLFWNGPLSFVSDSFIVLTTCALLNVCYWSSNTPSSRLNTGLALLTLILLALYPLITHLSLYRSRYHLRTKSFKKKYGALYNDYNTAKSTFFYYPLLQFYRRLLLPTVILAMPDSFMS